MISNLLLKIRLIRVVLNYLVKMIVELKTVISHNGISLIFSTPNGWSYTRAISLATKEPETIEWINSFSENYIFWDIGSNVGVYSLYAAAKHNNIQIFAFEPSCFNLELLARNIHNNKFNDRIVVIPFAISNYTSFDKIIYSSTEWGGALNTYKEKYTHDGSLLKYKFESIIPSMDLDKLVDVFDLETPDAIKIDVDGIEHLIINGANKLLKDKSLKTILIEVNDKFDLQSSTITKSLNEFGFTLYSKSHAEWADNSDESKTSFNQIWYRQ